MRQAGNHNRADRVRDWQRVGFVFVISTGSAGQPNKRRVVMMSVSVYIPDIEDEDISIDEIDACDDEQVLADWFERTRDLYEQIKTFITEFREAGVRNEQWLEAAAGKVAYLRIGNKRIENCMLKLGFTPPYPPSDPRIRQIQQLENALRRANAKLRENGIDVQQANA